MGVPNNRSHVRTSPVTISISEILKNVNKRDTAETAGQVQNELDVSPTDNISNNRLAQEKPIVKNSIFTLIKKQRRCYASCLCR